MNNALKYGFFLTASMVLWIIFMGTMIIIDYAYMIAQITILYFGIKAKKVKALRNRMTLRQGIMEGASISVIYAALSSVVLYIYYTIINPDAIRLAKRTYDLVGFSNKQILLADTASQFLLAVSGGLIVSVIISYFLTKKVK
ncbi:MAG: DUF4199 domain-containing protein [Candidatus Levybacteria bacterium]|nr:DUF4199 domain-containing protein [Candidatus Levybacteria bacterium]